MKRITKKSILESSTRYRNEQAILTLANLDDRTKDNYERKPLEVKLKKGRSPFRIGSICLSILP